MQLTSLLAIVSTLLGIVSTLVGCILWARSVVRKQYAAERDFAHLRRCYEQLAENQLTLLKEVDEITEVSRLNHIEIMATLRNPYRQNSSDNN